MGVHFKGHKPWIQTQPRSNMDWKSSKVMVGHVTEWNPHPFNQTRHLYWLETWKMKHTCFHFHTCVTPRPLPPKPPSNRSQPHTSHHSGPPAWGRKSGWEPMPSCWRTLTELDRWERRLSDLWPELYSHWGQHTTSTSIFMVSTVIILACCHQEAKCWGPLCYLHCFESQRHLQSVTVKLSATYSHCEAQRHLQSANGRLQQWEQI